MTEAARGSLELAAHCLMSFRDADGTDDEWVGALLLAEARHDLALVRAAFQKK